MIPLIDTHQHLWGISSPYLKPDWVSEIEIYNKNYRYEEYRQSHKGQIHKAIFMEVAVPVEDRAAEINLIQSLIEDPNTITEAMVIADTPGSEGFKERVLEYTKNSNIKGIRQIYHVDNFPKGECLKEEILEDLRFLGKNQLSFDLCLRLEEIEDAAKCAELCPETTFILDHCGNMFPNDLNDIKEDVDRGQKWKADISKISQSDNLICKLSGIVARANKEWKVEDLKPAIDHCIDSFGADKVIFGGDWPIFVENGSLEDWAKAFREIISDRSTEDQHKICHKNAERIYRL